MREQLREARATIVEQLTELQARASGGYRGLRGAPDYRSVYAELEAELREIDALLASSQEDEA